MNAAKLKKIEGQVRIGGKGSARRKRKHVQRTSTYDEKRLQATLQKLSLTTVPGVNSVTLTMDNGKEVMMNSPKVQGSVMANMFVFSGELFDVTVPEKKQENEDDEVPPLLVSGFDVIEEEQNARKSLDLTGKDLIIIEKTEQPQVKVEKDEKKKPLSLMENREEKKKVKGEKEKSSEQQLSKNKKKKKPKKPRNRIRSRNKIMTDANLNLQNDLDGAGDGQKVMQLKDLSKKFANLDDSTDANSNAGSDKTSIFSDNDSFMTLCPDDFNFISEDDAAYIEEEMSFLTICPNNDDQEQIGNNVKEPVKSSPDEDDIVINELNY